ncbi:four helix bundle protein [Pontibacter sp. BT310]|jgi:four helix bundle protein|uniref:Four helix bundle protein n=1 Tax=Pontibacter populi TaxID=890055 RepID=A0ABS6X8W1_9BACT|nr:MULTISPECIES: four helix bundle protein [Pontibacter]MBJ6117576.1 four helix bundle protein [Pontibacter sp. BT310]MBR0570001.1 four helix bundle protein [Microvirga sp. STS03]MBW3364429.1 four helix bundle protein [Pontibacter populi]
MQEKKHLQLNDLDVYKVSFSLSNYVWSKVERWDYFAKQTVGIQYVTAIDSISANIAEGFGRHGKKDKINFYRYARGSVYECLNWNEKSKVRKLLTQEEYEHVFAVLQKLPKMINSLIKLTNDNLSV